ncbi:putative ORFan [Tupanvirus deep ocean]|uniref:ORFan n=2 Tax=Tupanvirus TaxID=2094720 RepID=A0AC62A851_9VIRU|nr:putative ORFan [Tupanvirus deep ocean]QKU33838.1 putative ORFan [Tupanvirus deep ocean]
MNTSLISNRILHTPPKIDIAVVGDNNIGKTSLIKFWLSLRANTITTYDTYSKIFWMDNDPIQINIHKVSSENFGYNLENKLFSAIVYTYSIENITSKDNIRIWMGKMEPYYNIFTYQCVLCLSLDDISESMKHITTFQEIPHFGTSFRTPSKLINILNKITTEAYKTAEILSLDENKTNNNFHSLTDGMIEMDVFRENKTVQPLNLSCIEDEFYVLGSGNRFSNNLERSCCVIS